MKPRFSVDLYHWFNAAGSPSLPLSGMGTPAECAVFACACRASQRVSTFSRLCNSLPG